MQTKQNSEEEKPVTVPKKDVAPSVKGTQPFMIFCLTPYNCTILIKYAVTKI